MSIPELSITGIEHITINRRLSKHGISTEFQLKDQDGKMVMSVVAYADPECVQRMCAEELVVKDVR